MNRKLIRNSILIGTKTEGTYAFPNVPQANPMVQAGVSNAVMVGLWAVPFLQVLSLNQVRAPRMVEDWPIAGYAFQIIFILRV